LAAELTLAPRRYASVVSWTRCAVTLPLMPNAATLPVIPSACRCPRPSSPRPRGVEPQGAADVDPARAARGARQGVDGRGVRGGQLQQVCRRHVGGGADDAGLDDVGQGILRHRPLGRERPAPAPAVAITSMSAAAVAVSFTSVGELTVATPTPARTALV